MPRRETAARRYAEAAFQIGRADGTLDAWERDLEAVRGLLGHAELRRMIEHPMVPYGAKDELLHKVAGDTIGADALSLVLLMVRRGRPRAVERMIALFGELLRSERGIVLAEVRTAMRLEPEQRTAVSERLAQLAGDQVEMNEVVDESLIGGIAVRIGDRLYDASVRSRLERLHARLTAV